jgi:protein TonB
MRRLISFGLFALAPAVLAQGFYETQLRAGQSALATGRPQEAADDLRIAAFGFLDRPAMLCEALEALAVAQEKAGQAAPAEATLSRLVEIGRGFPACREARLEPGLRAEFESLARRMLPAPVADQFLAPPPVPTTAPTLRPTATVPPSVTPRPAAPAPTQAPVAPPVSPAAAPPPTPVPAAPPSPAPARPEGASVTPSEDLDRQPQLKVTTRPVYPAGAQRSGVGGIVLLRVLVSEKGEPSRVEIARGVQPDLDQAAVAAVRQWLFEPGQKGGKAVASWMTVAVPLDAPRR